MVTDAMEACLRLRPFLRIPSYSHSPLGEILSSYSFQTITSGEDIYTDIAICNAIYTEKILAFNTMYPAAIYCGLLVYESHTWTAEDKRQIAKMIIHTLFGLGAVGRACQSKLRASFKLQDQWS